MKTNAIVRIILFSVAILVLLGILLVGLGIGMFTFRPMTEQIDSETVAYDDLNTSQVFDAARIRDIQVEWVSGSITIQPGDTNEILLQEYGSGNPFVCRQSGEKLVVKFDDIDVYFGITIEHSKDLLITVPQDWVCGSLEIETASAEVRISNLTLENVEFDGASGDCIFDNCTVGELDIDTASGDVHFNGSLQALECDAASADCVLVLTNTPRMIDLDGASGDLDITLPEGSGFTVTLDGLSTNFTSDFDFVTKNDRYVCGDGSCRIEVDAMSGDLTIRKSAATGHHFHDDTCDSPDSTCPDQHHS